MFIFGFRDCRCYSELFTCCHPERSEAESKDPYSARNPFRIIILSEAKNPMVRKRYRFYTYIVGNISGTLYIGMTNNLVKRVWQHKQHEIEGFTATHEVDRLLYFETFDDVRNAINREKQLKRWNRQRKIALIEMQNPQWIDLSKEWYSYDRGPSTPLRSAQDDTPVDFGN